MADSFQVYGCSLGDILEPFQIIPIKSGIVESWVIRIGTHTNTRFSVTRCPFDLFGRLSMTEHVGIDREKESPKDGVSIMICSDLPSQRTY